MKQTLSKLMHLSDQTGSLRRRALDFGDARVALKLVHSEECTEQMLAYIIEAEDLSTKIFHANTETDRAELSKSRTRVEATCDVTSASDGAAMHSQDLSSEPVNLPEERQGSDMMSDTMRMIASTLAWGHLMTQVMVTCGPHFWFCVCLNGF
jgi:hypothetical protein